MTVNSLNWSRITCTYNGLGLRVGKTDSTGTYAYVCDGATPGSPVLSDGHALYTPGLSENRNGVSSYYSSDLLGNLWTVDGSSKNQLGYEDTTGFGTLTALAGIGGAGGTPFGFGGGNGCQTDADTGLILMGHRYYDTRIGRFITQDPIGDGDNWYAYADNSPTNEVDPDGLVPLPVFIPANGSTDETYTGDDGKMYSAAIYTNNTDQDINITVDTDNMQSETFNPNGSTSSSSMGGSGDDTGPSLWEDVAQGFAVGGAAVGSAASFHLWDGGAAKNDPSFGTSRGLADVGVAAATAAFGGEAAEGASGCFTKGTLVQTRDKPQEIQSVRVGELVATRSLQTGKTEYRKVVRTFKHLAYETVTVEFADAKTGKVVDTLTGTPEHPFYVVGQGMTALGKLGIGTLVVTRAGPSVVVHSLVRHHWAAGVAVYNIEVEGDHTYFVGNNGEWVHNNCVGDMGLEELQAEARTYAPWLKQLFGSNEKGAAEALDSVPKVEGLTKRMLEVYKELGTRQIGRGLDSRGVHALRIQIIDKVLGGM